MLSNQGTVKGRVTVNLHWTTVSAKYSLKLSNVKCLCETSLKRH